MTRLEAGIIAAMTDTGRAADNWRAQVIAQERVGSNSDIVRVVVHIYKPRSRKPDVLWDLCINAVKELIYWEHSTYYNAK